jgi:hypothetical protein
MEALDLGEKRIDRGIAWRVSVKHVARAHAHGEKSPAAKHRELGFGKTLRDVNDRRHGARMEALSALVPHEEEDFEARRRFDRFLKESPDPIGESIVI